MVSNSIDTWGSSPRVMARPARIRPAWSSRATTQPTTEITELSTRAPTLLPLPITRDRPKKTPCTTKITSTIRMIWPM